MIWKRIPLIMFESNPIMLCVTPMWGKTAALASSIAMPVVLLLFIYFVILLMVSYYYQHKIEYPVFCGGTPECNGRGTCVNATCQCSSSWVGPTCSTFGTY